MHKYQKNQQQVFYTQHDQLFLIKARLTDIADHGKRYSKSKLLEQLNYLKWEIEEL